MITIKKARRILGKLANSVSDEQLQKEMESAELLKDLFFNIYQKQVKTPKEVKDCYLSK